VGAILSSLFNRPADASTVIFGEVGLGGEIRRAMFPEIRLKEAATLGFKRGIVPSQPATSELHSAMKTVHVRDLREAQEAIFA